MKRGKPLKRGKRLRPFSQKREGEHLQRLRVIGIVHERDRTCVGLRLLEGHACWGQLDVHEIKTRARGGSPLDPDNAALICRRLHSWIHDHPEEARLAGLLKSSWE